ncbi:TetR/AcrR family transcriptional regulator [Mesorhizobium sp. B2-3-5]|uniref:TetR/AcrR family transcriptional regulator n=1 Tax=Mesorhizobium sp. B2-3-5 TaxID=2589958 RepID=UPI00112BF896|nr:TetR/AcrR family transcriptional regulator [Mesorhizobium sp. B2-3-5]TPM21587.1 TetR/AcrR family transcriptional regulator [Mesorhizobium sp. B2-3-5]
MAQGAEGGTAGYDVRLGRPPRDLAHEVDERILDAAKSVFLEYGLGGASIDEISRLSRAGKRTIYARFHSKEELFAAVGMRNAATVVARFQDFAPSGSTLQERLVSVGLAVLERLLDNDNIAFMQLSAAEARRLPQLSNFGRQARAQGVKAIMDALGTVAHSEETHDYPRLSPELLPSSGRFFADLVVARVLMRALLGEPLEKLRADLPTHVREGVAFFLAACRQPPEPGEPVPTAGPADSHRKGPA